MRTRFMLLAAAFSTTAGLAIDAGAGVELLTPETINQALAAGNAGRPARYTFRTPRVWVEFDTPYVRLARKVADAKESGTQVVDESLATADITRPVLRVDVGPEPRGAEGAEVKMIFIEQADGGRVAPQGAEKSVDYCQSKNKKKIALRGLKVTFPIEALQRGSNFRVVFDQGEELIPVPPAWYDQPR